jgi:hypothetical protein
MIAKSGQELNIERKVVAFHLTELEKVRSLQAILQVQGIPIAQLLADSCVDFITSASSRTVNYFVKANPIPFF